MLKLPETIQISGKQYAVKQNKSRWGGTCETGKQEISVGTKKNQSSQRIFGNFIHEVLEATAMEKSMRYTASDDEILFMMTHKQFDDYAKDVASSLWPIMKGK